MRGVYLSYTTNSSGQKKMVARLEDHVSLGGTCQLKLSFPRQRESLQGLHECGITTAFHFICYSCKGQKKFLPFFLGYLTYPGGLWCHGSSQGMCSQ